LDEIEVHAEIEKRIGYSSYPSHMLFFFATKQGIGIIFDNLGLQLDKTNLYMFDFKIKKLMILQLLLQVNCLQKNNIYHGDLKPPNICISVDGKLSLIDFGIAYIESTNDNTFELSNIHYNTTITSGSPEYKLIYEQQESKSPFPKELFDKSELWAIGGLIIGILLNDATIYFNKSLELLNLLKFPNENLETSDLSTRFSYFNQNFCDCIKQFINFNLSDCYDQFKPIILNMFEFDHTKRETLENIIKQIELIDL